MVEGLGLRAQSLQLCEGRDPETVAVRSTGQVFSASGLGASAMRRTGL